MARMKKCVGTARAEKCPPSPPGVRAKKCPPGCSFCDAVSYTITITGHSLCGCFQSPSQGYAYSDRFYALDGTTRIYSINGEYVLNNVYSFTWNNETCTPPVTPCCQWWRDIGFAKAYRWPLGSDCENAVPSWVSTWRTIRVALRTQSCGGYPPTQYRIISASVVEAINPPPSPSMDQYGFLAGFWASPNSFSVPCPALGGWPNVWTPCDPTAPTRVVGYGGYATLTPNY